MLKPIEYIIHICEVDSTLPTFFELYESSDSICNSSRVPDTFYKYTEKNIS